MTPGTPTEKTSAIGTVDSLSPAPSPRALQPFGPATEPFVLAQTSEFLFVFKPAGMNSVPPGQPRGTRRRQTSGPGGDLVSWLSTQLRLSGQRWGRAYPGRGDKDATPGSGDSGSATSAPGLLTGAKATEYAARFSRELGMLSRLDRETSGLILFARDFRSFITFLQAQEAGHVIKRYRLYVSKNEAEKAESPLPGALPPRAWQQAQTMERFTSSAPGGGAVTGFDIVSKFRLYGKNGARVACVLPGFEGKSHRPLSREAHSTHFDLRGPVPVQDGTGGKSGAIEALAMDAAIRSGFRHQIRAQMAWTGFPIIGDTIYGGHTAGRLFLESFGVEIAGDTTPSLCFNMYDL